MSADRQTYLPPEAVGRTIEDEETDAVKRASGKASWTHYTPEFVGTHALTMDLDKVFDQMRLAKENYEDSRLSQNEGRVKFTTDLPISIAHLGDLHLGSIYANFEETIRKIQEISDTPNMYCILMANLVENGIPAQYPNNTILQSIPPDRQVIYMRKIVEMLNERGKILAAVESPCHEGWTAKHTGQNLNALIFGFPERKFPVLENGGRLYVECQGVTYMGAIYHQVGPFESNFNETHALRQLNRLNLGMEADWVAGAHRHFAAAEEVYEGTGEHRRIVCYLRTGSEKGTDRVHDQFSQGRSGGTGEPTGQTIHIWPKERRIQATLHFDHAVLAHESFYIQELVNKDKT
jgi:hypothetical protein